MHQFSLVTVEFVVETPPLENPDDTPLLRLEQEFFHVLVRTRSDRRRQAPPNQAQVASYRDALPARPSFVGSHGVCWSHGAVASTAIAATEDAS